MGWWIKLNTQLKEHWLWNKKPFSKGQAWVDLLLLAETYTHERLWRGNLTEFKKGDVCLSIENLANRWGWNRKTVKRFLSVLERDQMVSLNVTKSRTTITLVNYEKFQGEGTSEYPSEYPSKGTSDGTSKRTYYKNIKNNKNNRVEEKEKKIPYGPDIIPGDQKGLTKAQIEELNDPEGLYQDDDMLDMWKIITIFTDPLKEIAVARYKKVKGIT